jgi:hypothetical protein
MAHQTVNLPKKEEIQQQLPITAIQHYRLLQQQRRAITTTTTTTLTHLQKTDMINTMSRGNQENRVGSVQGRQEDQEEEVAEVEEVEDEEEEGMKTENLEGTGNIGNESAENVSRMGSAAIGGEISEKVSLTQKRTHARLNIAQASGNKASTQKRTHARLNIAQASGNKASIQKKTTNIAQAGSIGVASGVANDSKQAQTQHLTARGKFENISTRATNIYSTYKATCIPNTSSDNNNNIIGIDNIIQNEEC